MADAGIDAAVKTLINDAFGRAVSILERNISMIHPLINWGTFLTCLVFWFVGPAVATKASVGHENPAGTLASLATGNELERDVGLNPGNDSAP
jgi:hypothetical protein